MMHRIHEDRSSRRAWSRLAGLFFGGTLAFVALGISPTAGPNEEESPETPPPSVVLLTLDTTRSDHLGSWGWPHARTPNLDALAVRGTRFTRCDASAPLTLPSHATLMTGLEPPRHGVRDNHRFRLRADVRTLAEELGFRGYDTAAVVSAAVLARGYGLDQGFRAYDDDLSASDRRGERTAEATTDRALGLIEELSSPYFLWVHYFDPHHEYDAPLPSASGPHGEYDAEIAWMDRGIGRLLEAIPENEVVIVAVGDHGEMLGEHGEARHGILPFAGVRRVPLIFSGPGVPQDRAEEGLVTTADVAPTILDLVGLGPADGKTAVDGRTLIPLLRGEELPPRLSYWEGFYPFFAFGWYPLRALSDGELLYVHGPHPRLYARRGGREVPVEASRKTLRSWRTRLDETLENLGDPLGSPPPPRSTARADPALESLGYLAGASGTGSGVHGDLPDPLANVGTANELQEAAGLVDEGECGSLLPSLERILEQDPDNPAARILRARCRLQSGDPDGAIDDLRRASRDRPDALILRYLGEALLARNRPEQALEAWRASLAADPGQRESAIHLARLLRRRDRAAEALEVLDGALRHGTGPTARLLFERGMALAAQDRPDAAYRDFVQAARLDPGNLSTLRNAYELAEKMSLWAEASRLLERILRLAPTRADLWTTLGDLYRTRLDRPAEAARAYRSALRSGSLDAGTRARLESLLRSLDSRTGPDS